jgi:hypothetical protein
MEERQSFEKTRNVEARLLKKTRIRNSTESSVCWGSEQDSLQGDEECWRGRNGEGLQAKTNMEKKKGICRHLSDNKFGSYPKLPRHLYIKLKNSV